MSAEELFNKGEFFPADVKKLSISELIKLASLIRSFIISSCAENPGHLASNLGSIELTLALHYVFDTPNDKLIWDVGHQSYTHKIITGRKNQFHSNRKFGGISGFPSPKESLYDAFGVGHSSTSISAALGISISNALSLRNSKTVAIIGDGSLTGGLAFEGLNNAGYSKSDILVVINNNNISIDKNRGAMSEYFAIMSSSKLYNSIKSSVWHTLSIVPFIRRVVSKCQRTIKSLFLGKDNNLFTSLGFRYFGIVDGNDLKILVSVLRDIKILNGPKVLQIQTVKGKGFAIAENNPIMWHAPGKFNATTGERTLSVVPIKRYQDIFGETLISIARENSKVVAVTPAMSIGCSMDKMFIEFPTRTFDVGIAESHAVTFSAGMAISGSIVFCNIYSSFFQRAYDNLIHDVALQNLHIILCLDRAGLVGEDGATHHGVFDLAFCLPIPNLRILTPATGDDLKQAMIEASITPAPTVIRYPRGEAWSPLPTSTSNTCMETSTFRIRHKGDSDLTIISVGHISRLSLNSLPFLIENSLNPTLIELLEVKSPKESSPMSSLLSYLKENSANKILVIEEGVKIGGVNSLISSLITKENPFIVKSIAIEDLFVEHGSMIQLYESVGFTKENILKKLLEF